MLTFTFSKPGVYAYELMADLDQDNQKKDAERYTFEKRATIGEAEEELSGLQFSRCSLSYLVNLKRVDRISKDTVIIGGHELPISRNRKKEFLEAFSDYLEAGF